MFAKLKQIIGSSDSEQGLASDLEHMMGLASRLVQQAGRTFFDGPLDARQRDAFYATDRDINGLEQKVRRQVVSRVTLTTPVHRARCLGFLGLVKDVERIGDYAKNLLEAAMLRDEPPPAPPQELEKLRADTEALLREALPVLLASDEARARVLLDRGHAIGVASDDLIRRLARSQEPASAAVPAVLAVRCYKRIAKHTMNILSSVVMPLDKIGYYE